MNNCLDLHHFMQKMKPNIFFSSSLAKPGDTLWKRPRPHPETKLLKIKYWDEPGSTGKCLVPLNNVSKCRVRELDLSPLHSKTVVGNSDKIFSSSVFPGFPQKGANIQSPMIG